MKYTIPAESTRDKVSIEVTAYKTDALGLIVHHSVHGLPYPTRFGRMWKVTHEKSGQGICGSFYLRKDAKEFAKRIKDMADWTQDAEDIKPHVSTLDIQRIYREVA